MVKSVFQPTSCSYDTWKMVSNARKLVRSLQRGQALCECEEGQEEVCVSEVLFVSWMRWKSLGDNKECQFSLSCDVFFMFQ